MSPAASRNSTIVDRTIDLTEQHVSFQKEGREEEDIITTPKPKGRKSDPEAKKKTPKKLPEDGGLKKRLNILYKTAYEYSVSRRG